MLTRLKVSGFKNLVDVDISFGPFTCVAGANGVGKSNLFDAIKFLSNLADDNLIDAALSVRDEGGKTADVRSIFHCVGDRYDNKISFEAEMIIPEKGRDDLRQKAKASITFLRYSLDLVYKVDEGSPILGSLEITHEELVHINVGGAKKKLKFDHSHDWRKSAIKGKRTSPFISTDKEHIKLHQEGKAGKPKEFLAGDFPRTLLSTVNATESPTALLAKREMQSWRIQQLEPSSLREPDKFTASPQLGSDGSHLAANLYYLARSYKNENKNVNPDTWIYDQVASRLSELIDDIVEVSVDRDEKRELLTLKVKDKGGTDHPARSLSDGTLRFLALAVLELDPEAKGLICMEEPENGIHPERIPAILRLLQDIAMDVKEPIGADNPLRQVIINTHSPGVVSQVPDDSLIVCELKEKIKDNQRFMVSVFSWLPDTWRNTHFPEINPVAEGKLLAYLNPVTDEDQYQTDSTSKTPKKKPRRVMDREYFRPFQVELFDKSNE